MSIEFSIKSGTPEKQRSACIVVGIFENKRLSPAAKLIEQASDKFITHILKKGDHNGTLGKTLLLHAIPGVLADRILLVGCGAERDFNDKAYRTAVTAAAKVLKTTGATDAVSYLTELTLKTHDLQWKIQQATVLSQAAVYEFTEHKSQKKARGKSLSKLSFMVPTRREFDKGVKALNNGMAIANGMSLTKDLGNRPGNICTPAHLARQAQSLAKKFPSLKVKILDEAAMKKLGMGSLLSVSQGSAQPAKLITLEYHGGKKTDKPTVLVGKGVTFDTGGISIKPSAAMDEMKYDMCGAATVMGCMSAVAEMQLGKNVVGVIPATENMPGSKATKPGDVFVSMSGQTIEVLNTDAEGRLILCDALTYSERFNPAAVIDIATLTGACVVALGKHASGLMTNHNNLAQDLLAAGEDSGDRAWQLPLWEEYDQQLQSPFADMANIGGRDAGTITAACFLSRFAKKFKWAHLDIAGTAWTSGKNKGATGRPVPLLMAFLQNKAR